MITDLQRALDALQEKQIPYTRFWAYYDGSHPLVYSTKKLRTYFNKINARFSLNFCAVVVNAVYNRIKLEQMMVAKNETLTKTLNDLWTRTELILDSDEITKSALVCGEAFAVAWKEEDEIQAFWHDSRNCHIFYDPLNPRKKQMACRWWLDGAKLRVTLYYPDRIEYYVYRDELKEGKIPPLIKATGFKPDGKIENPHDEVPMFRFVRERRGVKSEMLDVIEPQDAINKLFNDMMISAEFAALKQRYVIGDIDASNVESKAGNVVVFPQSGTESHPTQVGEFDATPLKNYLDAMDSLLADISLITDVPKHYFNSQGGDPSGEALIAMEAPLNKKCQKYIDRFIPEYRALGAFLLKLNGSAVDPYSIEPMFAKPQTVQPRTEAEIREIDVRTGIPLKNVLRDQGWTDEDLNQLDQDKAEEDQRSLQKQKDMAEVAMSGFDRGGDARE